MTNFQLWYDLDGKPIDMRAADALLRDHEACRVAHTTLTTSKGRVTVSTVFLVLDHGLGFGGGSPVLWETLTMGRPTPVTRRYTSREAAVAGHREAVYIARAEIDLDGATVIAQEDFEPGLPNPDAGE